MYEQTNLTQPWDLLQEPARPVNLRAGYMLLLAALDQGWHVQDPVIMTHARQQGEPCGFSFSLARGNNPTHTHKITITQCSEVEAFI